MSAARRLFAFLRDIGRADEATLLDFAVDPRWQYSRAAQRELERRASLES